TPNAGFAGVDSLWLGYQGVGANGVNYADANILIDEGANNVGVPINAPIPVQTATPTAPVVFSSAGGNAISLSNPGITATTPVQLTLSIGDGALALAETSGISIISGASGSSSLTIQGTIADINAALDGMTYTPAAADVGWTNLDLAASVLGNSSFGTTFNSVLIHDQLAFVPAAITVPATQAPSSTTPLVFSSAGGNAVSINDPAATGNVQVTLGVSSGSLSLGSTQGVVITAGANGTGSITLSGTQAAINAALDGLKYTITYGTTNDDTLTISLTDPGDSALGTVEASVAIDPVFPPSDDLFWSDSPSSSTVLPAPVVTLPSGSLPLTGTPAPVTGISVAGAALVEVTISVQNGVLNASKTTGVQIDDAGTASIELTGTVANVNAALATLVYTGNAGFVGTDSLSVSATAIAELPPPPDVLNGAGLPLGGPITNPIGVPVYPIGGPITTPIGGPIGIYNGGTPFTSTSGNLTTGTSTVATNVSTASVSTASVSTTSVSTASTSDIVTFPPLNEFEYSALPNEWSTDTSSATTATLSLLVGPPTINVPAPQKISGLLPLVFSTAGGNAISVTDSAVGNSPIQVTLSVASGTLTLASSSGLTFSGGTGTGNKTMTFTGDVSDVAAALDGLSYSANAGFSGTDTLNISVDDLGNGGGGPITVSDSVAIHVARTTAPTITISLPTSAYAVTPAGGSLPGVSISESGSNDIVQVTLSVKNGVLSTQGNGYSTLSDGTTIDTVANWPIGQTVTVTGVGTSTLVMTGSAAEIDALLEVQNPPPSQRLYSPGGQLILTLAPSSGLVYTPNSGFTGSDTLTVSAKDAVLANAPRTVSSVALNVRPPTINAPSTQTMADTAPLVFSSAEGNAISITQGNVGAGTIQVSLSVAHGTLSLASTAGLNFSLGTGTGNAAMTFTGNATDVNAALAGLSYSAGSGFTGTDKLVISVGTPGGSAPVSDSVSICVQPGPAPTVPISLPTAPVTIPAVGSQISGLTVGDLGFGPTSSLGNAQITFSVLNGTLTLPEGDGLSITGNGTSSITVTGQAGALDTDFCTSILTTMLPGSTPGRLIGFGEGPEGLFYTPNAGYSGADTLTVTTRSLLVENAPTTTATLALNDLAAVAPVVTASGTQATFTLGGSPAVVDPGIQVASTNTLLSGATITISPSTYQATDTLSFTPTGSIYGIYNNGVLTLAGIATPAEYQTALQSVTFGTGSTNSAARSISIVVLDASLSSNTASEQVLIAGGSSGTSSKQSSTTGLHGSGSSTGSPAVAHGNHSIGSLGMLSSSSGGHNSLSLDGKSTGPAPVDYNYLPPSQTSSVAVTVSPGSGSSSAGTAHQASSKKSLGALDQVFAGLEPDDLL
ncbi:MAG TPA: hypothetical protein VMF30_07610, partial [Pirellulales bacterium]|nr:hypothetical protein [Pirellulales bacterium]